MNRSGSDPLQSVHLGRVVLVQRIVSSLTTLAPLRSGGSAAEWNCLDFLQNTQPVRSTVSWTGSHWALPPHLGAVFSWDRAALRIFSLCFPGPGVGVQRSRLRPSLSPGLAVTHEPARLKARCLICLLNLQRGLCSYLLRELWGVLCVCVRPAEQTHAVLRCKGGPRCSGIEAIF